MTRKIDSPSSHETCLSTTLFTVTTEKQPEGRHAGKRLNEIHSTYTVKYYAQNVSSASLSVTREKVIRNEIKYKAEEGKKTGA